MGAVSRCESGMGSTPSETGSVGVPPETYGTN